MCVICRRSVLAKAACCPARRGCQLLFAYQKESRHRRCNNEPLNQKPRNVQPNTIRLAGVLRCGGSEDKVVARGLSRMNRSRVERINPRREHSHQDNQGHSPSESQHLPLIQSHLMLSPFAFTVATERDPPKSFALLCAFLRLRKLSQ